MKNLLIVSTTFMFLMLQCCAFKIIIKERYYSTMELSEYAKAKKYPFDFILKFKNANDYTNRRDNSIYSVNFMNIYSKENYLLKSSDGENCEFKIASFIRDSLDTYVSSVKDTFSLKELVSKSDIIQMVEGKDLFSESSYKILIGWSIGLNNFRMIKNRLEKLFDQIDVKSQKIIVIGMNLDPVR